MTGSIIEYGTARPGPPSRGSVLDEPATALAGDAWRQFEIECIDDRIKVTIDGKVVSEITNVQSSQGLLGLSAAAGSVEFRNVALRELSAPARMRSDGVYLPGDGLVLPRVRREVKPEYTRAAMEARIEGTVWIEAVVQRDGAVTDLKIIRSLDPKHGLDRQALRAASEWRFSPATKDGQPVPVLITIELTFTLRK
jgi:TonB family protein